MTPKLSAENVGLAYSDGDRLTKAIDDVSIELPGRGFYGVMGPSGSGKSSLLYIFCPASSGQPPET